MTEVLDTATTCVAAALVNGNRDAARGALEVSLGRGNLLWGCDWLLAKSSEKSRPHGLELRGGFRCNRDTGRLRVPVDAGYRTHAQLLFRQDRLRIGVKQRVKANIDVKSRIACASRIKMRSFKGRA